MKEVCFLQIQITLTLKDTVSCAVPPQVFLKFNNIKIFTYSNINIISYNDNIRESFHLFIYCNKVGSKHFGF